MKCERCSRTGDTSIFKQRQFHQINRTYYVCNKCGTANRPTVDELKPKDHWGKKALAKSKEIRSAVLRSSSEIELNILVWGPGPGGGIVYRKREQIRDALRRRKNIYAYFSEELPLTDETGSPIPHDRAEVFQTEFSDLVINVADSASSLMEAQKFTEGLGDRCLLWLRKGISGFPEGLITSLTTTGRAPFFFDDEDMKSCVVAKASEDWVHIMRVRELEFEILKLRISQTSIKDRKKIQ